MNKCHVYTDNSSGRIILHVWDIPTHGQDYPILANAAEFRAYLAAHPEIEAVNVIAASSRGGPCRWPSSTIA